MTRADAPVFLRLVHLECRKLVDTRSSRWVLACLGLLSVLGAVAALAGTGSEQTLTFSAVLVAMLSPLALAMAVLGVLGMTGDWAHRVTTTYFPLLRSRSEVYAAKVLATLIVSALLLGALLVAALLLLAVVGLTGRAVAVSGVGEAIGLAAVTSLLGTGFGLGVAAVVRRLALSLVLIVVLTLGVNALAFTLLPVGLQPVFSTLTPLVLLGAPEDAGVAAWQVLASCLLWYVLPLVAGWRIAGRVEA